MQDKAKHDDVAGGGLGYVVEYSPDGALLATVASQGKANAPLNAPWGRRSTASSASSTSASRQDVSPRFGRAAGTRPSAGGGPPA
jgi:hypothetical protein